jgi:hypothetical protein
MEIEIHNSRIFLPLPRERDGKPILTSPPEGREEDKLGVHPALQPY